MLGGVKFAVRGGLRPVYRPSRFEADEALLSGPAWAGVLAVISARRAALRAWLGEGAARYLVVGALTAGLGIQAGTSAPVAHGAAKPAAKPAHASAGRATGRAGLAAFLLQLCEASDDHRVKDRTTAAAAEAAAMSAVGAQRWNPSHGAAGAVPAFGERAYRLSQIGMFDLPGAGGSISDLRRSGAANSSSASTSSEPGSLSDGGADPPLPAPANVSGWLAGFPIPVFVAVATPVSTDISTGRGSDAAPSSRGVAQVLSGLTSDPPSRVGGSVDLTDAGPSSAPSDTPQVPAPGGSSEALNVPGLVGGGSDVLSGVPEPSAWAIMVLGLGLLGSSVRHRRAKTSSDLWI